MRRHATRLILPIVLILLGSPSGFAQQQIMSKDGAPMILVPAGVFLYGEEKLPMSLPSYFMDKYEVTTERYAKFLKATGGVDHFKVNQMTDAGDKNRPIIGVEWKEADTYCKYYGKRLPTEQEWEKAARGTDGRKYPWGDKEPTKDLASFDWDAKRNWSGYKSLSNVGSIEAGKSPFGIYDLAGNVGEWTATVYERETMVVRGGSWLSDGMGLRVTRRRGVIPTYRLNSVGFRCVQVSPP